MSPVPYLIVIVSDCTSLLIIYIGGLDITSCHCLGLHLSRPCPTLYNRSPQPTAIIYCRICFITMDQRAHLHGHFRVLADIRNHPRHFYEQDGNELLERIESLANTPARNATRQNSPKTAVSHRNVHYWMPLRSKTDLPCSNTTTDNQQFTPSSTPSVQQLPDENDHEPDAPLPEQQPLQAAVNQPIVPKAPPPPPTHISDPNCSWPRSRRLHPTYAAQAKRAELVSDTRPYLKGSFRHALREAGPFLEDDLVCDRIQEMCAAVDKMDHALFCVSSWYLRERIRHLSSPVSVDW